MLLLWAILRLSYPMTIPGSPHFGIDPSATEERTLRGRLRPAITWGHNKDHRPDLKQLLYILTVTDDGGVPVQFRVQSGNITDDRTHRETWDFLCQLAGRATSFTSPTASWPPSKTWPTSARNGGRFVSVLPRTRERGRRLPRAVQRGKVDWRHDPRQA